MNDQLEKAIRYAVSFTWARAVGMNNRGESMRMDDAVDMVDGMIEKVIGILEQEAMEHEQQTNSDSI